VRGELRWLPAHMTRWRGSILSVSVSEKSVEVRLVISLAETSSVEIVLRGGSCWC
jgi:hypothetical protein